jgi:hypothetical protein
VQDVVGATRDLARDRQDRGLSGLAPRLDTPVQGTVRASPIAGLVRGLHERPAKLRRAMLGEVAAPRPLPGVVDDRVEAGGTHRGAGAAEALRLAEFGEDVAGEDRADAVDRLERLAACGCRLSVRNGEPASRECGVWAHGCAIATRDRGSGKESTARDSRVERSLLDRDYAAS